MKSGALFWMIVFGISAAAFFVVAVVVTIKGFGDLRDLLRPSDEREPD